MTTHRLIPPSGGPKRTVNGRSYDPAGGAQDVPDYDSAMLQANGWSMVGISAATAGRPSNPSVGTRMWDTTVSHTITWDGKNWKDEGGTTR